MSLARSSSSCGNAPRARADEPFTIRAAWAAVPGQMFPILMQMKNVLVHYGKSYVVEAIRTPGSGPQTTALASGDLNLAYFAPSAFALAIQNAHMDDLRLIGEATRDGYQTTTRDSSRSFPTARSTGSRT